MASAEQSRALRLARALQGLCLRCGLRSPKKVCDSCVYDWRMHSWDTKGMPLPWSCARCGRVGKRALRRPPELCWVCRHTIRNNPDAKLVNTHG